MRIEQSTWAADSFDELTTTVAFAPQSVAPHRPTVARTITLRPAKVRTKRRSCAYCAHQFATNLLRKTANVYESAKMKNTIGRRHFIELIPFMSIALLAACTPEAEPTATTTVTPSAPAIPATPSGQAASQHLPASTEILAPRPQQDSTETSEMPMVDEKSAQAVLLGYVADTGRVDKVKFKTHITDSRCSGCALFLGKAGDTDGGCPIFPGKRSQPVAGVARGSRSRDQRFWHPSI